MIRTSLMGAGDSLPLLWYHQNFLFRSSVITTLCMQHLGIWCCIWTIFLFTLVWKLLLIFSFSVLFQQIFLNCPFDLFLQDWSSFVLVFIFVLSFLFASVLYFFLLNRSMVFMEGKKDKLSAWKLKEGVNVMRKSKQLI